MRPRRPQQLPLPNTLEESAKLHEDLAGWRAHCAFQGEALRQAQQDVAAVRRQLTEVTTDRDFWRTHAQHLQAIVEFDRTLLNDLATGRSRPRPTAPEPWVGAELRKLLTLAHPDKWSQGQPAETLAHELTVVVNGLRARLQGGAL